jgi:parallel beta-helix repeat protein
MLVNADNVSLSNFTLYGPTVDAASAYGIKVQPAGSAASSRLANFSISNVTSRGAGRAELDLNGVLGASIDHVTANGAPVGNDSATTKGAGIQLTDSANVTIANSTTRNNAWGGVALFESNRFFDQQTSNVSVSSSNVFTESNPLYLQNDSAGRTFGTLTLEGFNFVVRNSDTASNNNQFTFLQYGLAGALDLAENLSAPGSGTVQGWNGSAATHDFYVGFGNLLGGGTRALSIGTALNASSSGDTLNIGSGRFAEDVVITSPRNLRFDGSTVHSLVINGSGSGIAGSVTADGGGITFNAPAVLLGNTSLSTMGANIAFNGDLQNAGGTAFALGLSAGMGDIAMVSGGTSTNPLGALTVAANDFSLTGTLWVTTFNFNMSGNVALSNHSLHATVLGATNVLQAGGSVTGTTVSASPIVVSAGGDVTMNVDAPSGSTIVAAGHADVDNIGTGIVTVNGVPMLGADIAANADNSRVIPPDSALPKDFTLPTPPTGGGQREIQVVADAAGDAIDQGFSVEIDLRPGRRRPR